MNLATIIVAFHLLVVASACVVGALAARRIGMPAWSGIVFGFVVLRGLVEAADQLLRDDAARVALLPIVVAFLVPVGFWYEALRARRTAAVETRSNRPSATHDIESAELRDAA